MIKTYSIIDHDVVIESGLTLSEAIDKLCNEFTLQYGIRVDSISWVSFIQIKLKEFTYIFEEAKTWEFRMNGGPMNEEQFASFANSVDIEGANSVNRLQSRTYTGWVLSETWKWIRSWNKAQYENMYTEYAETNYFDTRYNKNYY